MESETRSPDDTPVAAKSSPSDRWAVSAAELDLAITPGELGFGDTSELEPLDRVLGQERALEALEHIGSDFKLFSIDFAWLDEYLGSHADELPFATVGGRKLITASTAELQAFVVKHRDRFSVPFELERKDE